MSRERDLEYLRWHAIWALLAKGAKDDEIAEVLNVPEVSVRHHRQIQSQVNGMVVRGDQEMKSFRELVEGPDET